MYCVLSKKIICNILLDGTKHMYVCIMTKNTLCFGCIFPSTHSWWDPLNCERKEAYIQNELFFHVQWSILKWYRKRSTFFICQNCWTYLVVSGKNWGSIHPKQVILPRIIELIEIIQENINIFHLSYPLLRQCKKKKDVKSFLWLQQAFQWIIE